MTSKKPQYDKGFLIVASCHAFYKNSALSLLDSLDEYYPDCKVMIVCPPEWEDEFRVYSQVVEVRTDGPDERRTKLWALRHTVFEKTCYLDADMEVVSADIAKIWDELDDEHDCAFTVIYPPAGSTTAIYVEEGVQSIRDNDPEKHLRYHGGFFVWWHNEKHPNSIKAMEMWWGLWNSINKNSLWWDKHPEYFDPNRGWDQFTFWYIHRKEIPDLKIKEINDMYRWNWNSHLPKHLLNGKEPIIRHHIINRQLMDSRKDLLSGNNTKAG